MLWQKGRKREGSDAQSDMTDVEMGPQRKRSAARNVDDSEDTEYKPINWKKIFLTPKYIRTLIYLTAPALFLVVEAYPAL